MNNIQAENERFIEADLPVISNMYLDLSFIVHLSTGMVLEKSKFDEQEYAKFIAKYSSVSDRMTDNPKELYDEFNMSWDTYYEYHDQLASSRIFLLSPPLKTIDAVKSYLSESRLNRSITGDTTVPKITLNTYPLMFEDDFSRESVSNSVSSMLGTTVSVISKPYSETIIDPYDIMFIGDFMKFTKDFENSFNGPDLMNKRIFAPKLAHDTQGKTKEELDELFDLAEVSFNVVTDFEFIATTGFL